VGLEVPRAELSAFQVQIRFTLYSEKGQRNTLKVLFSLYQYNREQPALKKKKRSILVICIRTD